MPSNFRQADDPGRLAEDYGRLITLRALVEIVRIDLAGFDVKTFQVFQPGTQHPRRNPERTVERAENAIFGPQTEKKKVLGAGEEVPVVSNAVSARPVRNCSAPNVRRSSPVV